MLKAKFLLLAVFVSLASCYSNDIADHQNDDDIEPDPELEEYLREAIENFREQMKDGISAIGMPVLDPFTLHNMDIDVNENLATMNLRIKKMLLNNLSSFNITALNPNLEELYVAINLTLPYLFIHGQYNVSGRLLKIFPIYGHGLFQINATEINIAGKGQLSFTSDTVQLSLLKLDMLWHKMTVFMENFLGGGDFSSVLQRIVPDVGRDVFVAYRPEILEKLSEALTKEINLKLDDPKVREIIKGVFP